MFKAIVVLCLAIGLSLDISGAEDNFAVDLETKLGGHYQLPYFPDLYSVDVDFEEEFSPLFLRLKNHVAKLCKEALDHDDPTHIGPIGILKAGHNTNKLRRLLKRNDETMGPWYIVTGDFFKQILDNAVKISKKLQASNAQKDEKQLIIDIRNQYLELEEVAKNSRSVALFVDWPLAKINGRLAMDFYAELLGRYRYVAGEKAFDDLNWHIRSALDLSF